MKILKNIAACVFLVGVVFGTSSFASDEKPLDLLDGVSDTQIEILSDNEAGDTRGERVTVRVPRIKRCGWRPCLKYITYTYIKKIGEYKGRSIYVRH